MDEIKLLLATLKIWSTYACGALDYCTTERIQSGISEARQGGTYG